MRAIGVVAEYDPFHSGHAYHLAETRRMLGEDLPVVAVMSGSWTQRGSCALTDKWTRAALALRGGADLVLELPVTWAVASAERFARGAVETLAATGVVDVLTFGSECGDLALLHRAARCIDSPEYLTVLDQVLKEGSSFAASRETAVTTLMGEDACALREPNNNLGVEYLRALHRLDDPMQAVTVQRKNPYHSAAAEGEHVSAEALRGMICTGEWEKAKQWLLPGTAQTLLDADIADSWRLETAILSRLRLMTEEDFAALPDSAAGEGLPARLVRVAKALEVRTLQDFIDAAQTRRYPYSRIRRMTLWAFFHMTREDLPDHPLYLRVLGFDSRGQELLHEMKEKASLPILTKTAHIGQLDEAAQRLFELECRATDLFALSFSPAKPCGLDYTTGPVVLR